MTTPKPEKASRRRRPPVELATIVAHEIRGPLGVVTALTEILASRALGAEDRQLVDLIRLAATHSRMVAEDLVTDASLQAGKFRAEIESVDLAALFRTISDLFEPLGGKSRLKTVIADDAPRLVNGDKRRLTQLLFNLVSNALKSADRAEVTITLTAGPDPEAYIIDVADNGPGLADGFEIRPYRSASSEGTGLGLWISAEIARALGGKLTLTSAAGGGTVARLEFPAGRRRRRKPSSATAGTPLAPHATDTESPPPSEKEMTELVLIIDDSAVSRQLMVAILASLGLETVTAANGREALDLIAGQRPDLIITDWILAGETGGEVLHAIESQMGPTMPPVLVVTAMHRLPDTARRYHRLEKPFAPSELLAAIQMILSGEAENLEFRTAVDGNLTLGPT